MIASTLTHWTSTAPRWQTAAVGISALAAAAAVWRLSAAAVRKLRRYELADVITVMVALAATIYAGSGNWKFLGEAMHYGTDLRVILVAVYEGAVIAEGLRSRRNIAETGAAGADGIGLWVLTAMSGLLATSVSANFREALGRLAVPVVGAWLWERLLAPERRAHKARRAPSVIRWRITRERIAVWLRLADSTDTDVSRVESARRVIRFLRATDRAARGLRNPLSAAARADRTRVRLASHALLTQGDPEEVLDRLAKLMLSEALTQLGVASTSELPDSGTPELRESASQDEAAPALMTLPLRKIDPGTSSQDDASLPPAREQSSTGGRRVAAASTPARRQASVTARIGVDRDSAARIYRESVEQGNPLSSRSLARRSGLSQSTAARIIREARGEASAA